MLDQLHQKKHFLRQRKSSWDRTGANRDAQRIEPSETHTLPDPIPFETSLLATTEHGHANDCETHYRSIAYWYGRRI